MRTAFASPGPRMVAHSAQVPRSTARLLSLRRTTSLTILLLTVVVTAAVYGIYHSVQGSPIQLQLVVWSACGMLACTAIAMLLIGRHLMQRSLAHLEEQLQVLARDGRLEPLSVAVPEELRSVMVSLSEYVEQVRERVDRLRVQKKELDIQMRAAEAQRRHTEAIIFSISDAVLVVDTYGEIVVANAAAERIFNFRPGTWRFRPLEKVIQDASLVTLIKDARSDVPSSRRQLEYSLIRENGSQTFNITLSAVVDGDGESRGVVAVFHDITREREIAQIKTDFVSAVSHELRTPLSSIKAYAEMLLDGEARNEEARQDFYHIISAETERMQRLISKILDISRIESGVMEIHRTEVRPNEVVEEVMGLLEPQARERGITLERQLSAQVPLIEADRDLLYQAVQNVLGNAIKYTRPGGRVCVATGSDDEAGCCTISVADNGMGIRSEDLPRIFDKFFRSRDGSTVAKGSGLGLNLVKQIVETVHGGEISVASEQGVGTTMVLRLPHAGRK